MNTNRDLAIHGLLAVGGLILGWRAWPGHPIIGAIIGHVIGSQVARLATGTDPVAEAFARMRQPAQIPSGAMPS